MAVKQQERPKDKAGSALKSISRGVKHEGKADRPSSRNAADTKKSNASRQGQGIANRDAREEHKRQSRVIPFREQGRRTPRRKTG
jgi:hypothetical protein